MWNPVGPRQVERAGKLIHGQSSGQVFPVQYSFSLRRCQAKSIEKKPIRPAALPRSDSRTRSGGCAVWLDEFSFPRLLIRPSMVENSSFFVWGGRTACIGPTECRMGSQYRREKEPSELNEATRGHRAGQIDDSQGGEKRGKVFNRWSIREGAVNTNVVYGHFGGLALSSWKAVVAEPSFSTANNTSSSQIQGTRGCHREAIVGAIYVARHGRRSS